MSEWQPIETAPNAPALVTDGGCCFTAFPDHGRWFVGFVLDDGGSVRVRFYPTHWMPLPPPPEPCDNQGDGR